MSNFTLAAAMTLDNRRFLGPMRQSQSATRAGLGGLKSLIAPLATLTAGYLSLRSAVGLANQSLGQAAGAERTRATFEILLGSAKEAKSLFDDLTQFSDVTPFEPGPVQDAAKALLAAKFETQDLKSLLTDAGDLASVMDADLSDVARVFARLNSGDFGESFERLRDFGISRQDLEGEGLVFDRGGSFQGSIEQAMTAVRNIIQTRFGGTMERISRTNDGLKSTLIGGWKEVQRVFGEPINDALKPVLLEGIELVKGMKADAAGVGTALARGMRAGIEAVSTDQLGELVAVNLMIAGADFVNMVAQGMRATFFLGVTILKNGFEDIGSAITITFKRIGTSLAEMLLNALADAADAIPGGSGALARERAHLMWQRGQDIDRERSALVNDPDRWNLLRDPVGQNADLDFELFPTADLKQQRKAMVDSLVQLADAFDPEQYFGPRKTGPAAPGDFSQGGLAAFREAIFPASGSGGSGATDNPLAETAQSIRAVTADRLQRIGGFVGGSSPERRSADRTAKATEESARRLKAIESKLTNPTGMPGAAAWA